MEEDMVMGYLKKLTNGQRAQMVRDGGYEASYQVFRNLLKADEDGMRYIRMLVNYGLTATGGGYTDAVEQFGSSLLKIYGSVWRTKKFDVIWKSLNGDAFYFPEVRYASTGGVYYTGIVGGDALISL